MYKIKFKDGSFKEFDSLTGANLAEVTTEQEEEQ